MRNGPTSLLAVAAAGAIVLAVTTSAVTAQGSPAAGAPAAPAPEEAQMVASRIMNAQALEQVAMMDKYFAMRSAWLDSPLVQNLDISKLPREYSLSLSLTTPEPSLEAAIGHADMIVAGVATAYTFNSKGSTTSVKVTQGLKGSTPIAAMLEVQQSGQPEPRDGFSAAVLSEAQFDPVVLPGEEVVLFLVQDKEGRLAAEPWSGRYTVQRGVVRPTHGNAFADQVNGIALADFLALVRSVVG